MFTTSLTTEHDDRRALPTHTRNILEDASPTSSTTMYDDVTTESSSSPSSIHVEVSKESSTVVIDRESSSPTSTPPITVYDDVTTEFSSSPSSIHVEDSKESSTVVRATPTSTDADVGSGDVGNATDHVEVSESSTVIINRATPTSTDADVASGDVGNVTDESSFPVDINADSSNSDDDNLGIYMNFIFWN